MPNVAVTDLANCTGQLLLDWASDPTTGGPLAGHDHAEVRAYAGAGKTHWATRAVRRAIKRGRFRVLVVAFTNEQVRQLAERLADLGVDVVHLCTKGQEARQGRHLTSVSQGTDLRAALCVVATIWQAAFAAEEHPGLIGAFHLGVVDEAYQVRSDRTALWAQRLAERWIYVGDPGQIEVFSSLGASPYIGTDDPVCSVVDSARAQGADLGLLDFAWTWRLPHHGAALLTPFYDAPVQAVAEVGDRALVLGRRQVRGRLARAADAALDRTAAGGWGLLELPGDAMDPADPLVAEAMAQVVVSVLARHPETVCERDGLQPLTPADIGVAVATDAQLGLMQAALADAGVRGTEVRTYNRHQGLEYALSLLWHPLSGIAEVDGFYLDLGRLCVGQSRHRHGAVVVGRGGLRRLLADPPVSEEAPWPGQRDRMLGGWLAHAQLLAHLDATGAVVGAS